MHGHDVGSLTPPRIHTQMHVAFENNFWATKMALTGSSTEALSRTKVRANQYLASSGSLISLISLSSSPCSQTEYENFLGDPQKLKDVRAMMKVKICPPLITLFLPTRRNAH